GTIANPSATSFQGIFDGNGKRIIGLTINRSGENGVGLFGCIGTSGSVQNLILEGGGVAGKEYVGNLAGQVKGGRVESCAATGSISGVRLTGGLVGSNSSGTIENCCATGEVTGNSSVGGLVGGNTQSFVRNSFATGAVTGSSYVGGLVGSSPQSTVTACYWDKATTGQVVSAGSDAGFGKTTAEMKQMATFAGWDFASIWGIVEGQSYPYLRFSPPPFRLSVSIVGPGSVTLNPPGGVYAPGTPVTLTATPAAGARFAGWTGAGTSETVLSISLLVDAPKGVTAHFRRNYEIRTLAELQAIATSDDFDGYYTLMNDLDASGTANWNDAGTTDAVREGFRPIGTALSATPSYFRGVFDGNGKKITGLTINRPGASHAGLFALLGRGGEIRNLTLENCWVTGDTNVGALVAYNSEGTVVNC
ncbi:MAG TPA: GLUG motif-containing protein, partial [Candidatus Sumerlaeota bacterium]|nr:GLUG motif-containing protein [Candidatus Sumerlaeota bacterium]